MDMNRMQYRLQGAIVTLLCVAFLHGVVDVKQPPGEEPVQHTLNLCDLRTILSAELHKHFAEQLFASGLIGSDAILEIFVSSGGSWTLLTTGTDGVSCILAVGEGFDANVLPRGDGV